MEFLVGGGIVFQQLTGFKLWTILARQAVHQVHVFADADLIQVAEGTAAEWGKARSKYQTNITDHWIFNNFIFQAFGGFVDKSEEKTRRDQTT